MMPLETERRLPGFENPDITAFERQSAKSFLRNLDGLDIQPKFINRWQTSAYARELRTLLDQLGHDIQDPRLGVELVAAFFQTDEVIFNRCDDSGGIVGDVFTMDATELFVRYAARWDDKQALVGLLLELDAGENYGVRERIMDNAGRFLPEHFLRDIVQQAWGDINKEKDEYKRRGLCLRIETLARQLKDAPLFEKARMESWNNSLNAAAFMDIAEAYLQAGDPKTALARLMEVPDDSAYDPGRRNRLLLAAYGALGDQDNMTKIAWLIFRSHRSRETLNELLSVIGADQLDSVIAGEIPLIEANKELKEADAEFLLEFVDADKAETYLLERSEQLDGEFYATLLRLAEPLEERGKYLGAAIIYRKLLGSILARGISKYYGHGVRYLKHLDELAERIDDWRGFENHAEFKDAVRKAHFRKTAFWTRYEPHSKDVRPRND